MSEVSQEARLTAHWEQARVDAQKALEVAEYNLGRVSLIYGGQLHFEETDGTES